MSHSSPNLSLVVLAFNEEESVGQFLHETLAWLDTQPGEHDVVLVDDGSTDNTIAIAQDVADKDPRVHLVCHPSNQGMGAGMRSGIEHARGDYFVMLPADGQVSPASIEVLLPALQHADIVTSVYTRRANESYRLALSAGLRGLMRMMLGLTFRLEGIYLFPISVAKKEIGLHNVGSSTFFFSFELIARAMGLGHRVETVTIEPRAREHGESKVANWSRIRRVGEELIRFRIRLLQEGKLRV